MSKKDENWKKVKMKEHYHGKIHVVEKDENGNERDTGLFICGGMNLVPECIDSAIHLFSKKLP